MKKYKFSALEKYFKYQNEDRIDLTFKEIENILGFKLSPSAYKHRAYWSSSKTHTLTKTWLNSGYKMNKINLQTQEVQFLKNDFEKKENIQPINPPVKRSKDIDTNLLIEKIDKFLDEIDKDENSRYMSWEHCYRQFRVSKDKSLAEKDIDFLSLHLAFYLASWGMYRGSSFLLQKDYKVHKDTVRELYKEKYKPLWGISCQDLLQEDNLNRIFDLKEKLNTIYIEKRKNLDSHKNVSDILISKILMGTLGCVPAYDRFFVAAIRKYNIASGVFSKKSIYNLAKFYEDNRTSFEKCRKNILRKNFQYPQIKLIDMCFWQIGYDLENKDS